MNLTKTLLAAAAALFIGGAASAATVDPFLGADNVSPSNPENELLALADILGTDPGNLEFDQKWVASDDDGAGTDFPVFDIEYDETTEQWSFDVSPNTPGWFVLKLGNNETGYTHFFFENSGEPLTELTWADEFTLCPPTGGNLYSLPTGDGVCAVYSWSDLLEEGMLGGKLSHITTFVPIPAAGWLLLGGLGGLAAFRRRKS